MGNDKSSESKKISEKGWQLVQQGESTEALKAFENAIALDSLNSQAWRGYGSTLVLLGRYLEAVEAFRKAIKLDPAYAPAWNNKGIALGSLERHQEALEAFEKAISLNPTYPGLAWQGPCSHQAGEV